MGTTVECARCNVPPVYAAYMVVISFLSDVGRAVFIFFAHNPRSRLRRRIRGRMGYYNTILYYNDCDVTAPTPPLARRPLS